MQLRPYQTECVEAIVANSRKGVNRQIMVMATGTGKTVVFAQLPKMVKNKTGKKTLILAHREELLEQAKDKLLGISPELKVEIEQAGRRADPDSDVVIASVPTIGRANSPRIQKFDPNEFGLVIVDECFVRGTKVDGKAIEKIKVRDFVNSFNERTGKVGKRRVTTVWQNKMPEDLIKVILSNGKKIITTRNHPFWVRRKKWVKAENLKKGMVLKDSRIECVRVESIEILERGGGRESQKVFRENFVYNLEVEGNNNYFANGVLVHNCHHATAETYKNILKYFGLSDKINKTKLLLGATATAVRGDNVSLSETFDKIAFSYPIQRAIEDGFLCPIHGYTVQTKTDISNVHLRMGDFALGELEDAINNPPRNQLVAQTYKKLCPDKRVLVFGATVQHCYDLQEAFEKEGVEAQVVVGETEKGERAAILHGFKTGEDKVVISCGVLTEGFDCPPIEGIFLARPTKSVTLYAQIIGRGTRLSPATGKDRCLIVDFIDNISAHRNSVMMLSRMFGISGSIKMKGEDVTKVVEQIKMVLEANPAFDPEEITDWSDENIESVISKVSIFEMAKTPKEIQLHSNYAWGYHPDGYRIELPEDEEGRRIFVQLTKDLLDKWTVLDGFSKKEVPSFHTRWKGKVDYADSTKAKVFTDIGAAFKYADSLIPHSYNRLVSQSASWRKSDPTSKQIKLLKRFGITVPKGLTKGEASNLLSLEFSKKRKPTF